MHDWNTSLNIFRRFSFSHSKPQSKSLEARKPPDTKTDKKTFVLPRSVSVDAQISPNSSSQRRKVLQMYGKSMSLDTEPGKELFKSFKC